MRIIAIANQKGGVAKTTTAAHLAHGLALAGARVLAIDCDPQGQLSSALGMKAAPDVYELLVSRRTRLADLLTEARPGLFLLAGNRETAAAAKLLQDKPIDYLAGKLEGAEFDYCIIDTAPSVGDLLAQAIYAAGEVLIPASCDFFSVEGALQVLATINQLANTYNWRGGILAVQPCFFDRTQESAAILEEITRHFGAGLVLDPIHRAVILRQAAAAGQTVFELDPTGRAAQQYARMVEYVRANHG